MLSNANPHDVFSKKKEREIDSFRMARPATNQESVSHHPQGIPNVAAFRDVLCDLELWHGAPPDVEKSLFEHFHELMASDNSGRNLNNNNNTRRLRDFSLVDKLLGILRKPTTQLAKSDNLFTVIRGLLSTSPR